MDPHVATYLILGLALAGMTVLPRCLEDHPLSLPLLYVLAGVGIFYLRLGFKPLNLAYNQDHKVWVEYFTEFIVITSLASAGLKLDREFSFKKWGTTWRLLAVVMVPSIAVVAFFGNWLLGIPMAGAILLGACLAPTDPVLAEDIEVGTPHEGEEDEVRFGLTTEASFNDALAFPFVYLAMHWASHGQAGEWLWTWFGWDFCYRIVMGVAVGLGSGWLLAKFLVKFTGITSTEDLDQKHEGTEGLFVLAGICLAYGLAELVSGYGFLSVFVAACVWKKQSPEGFSRSIYRSASQLERILLAAMLIGLGGMFAGAREGLLNWKVWALAAGVIFLVRPVFGWLAMMFSGRCWEERAALAVYGIRGIGSIYYLAFGLRSANFEQGELIWHATAATIILSLTVHGLTANPVMTWLDRLRDEEGSKKPG